MNSKIRKYETKDIDSILELYFNTIRNININDYKKEEVEAWATGNENPYKWDLNLSDNLTLVYLLDEKIVGFISVTKYNLIDYLFIHQDHQRESIASELLNQIESTRKKGRFDVFSSKTAYGFFLKNGFEEYDEQIVERNGQKLQRFYMVKDSIKYKEKLIYIKNINNQIVRIWKNVKNSLLPIERAEN